MCLHTEWIITMALLNGKTPDQIADEIVNVDPEMIEMDGNVHQDLIKITRYQFRDVINVRGEKYWEKNKADLISEAFKKLITDKADTLTKYVTAKENKAKADYFHLLRSKGMSIEDASKQSGYEL